MNHPDSKEFEEALLNISQPKGRQKRFLQAHWKAPKHARTATQLAASVSYKSYRAINLQYGLLADRIGRYLNVKVDPGADRLYLLCEFAQAKTLSNSDCILFMRPEFAEALQAAKWVS